MKPPGILPYPGLRAFTREESHLFFGRDDCVDAMVDRFAETRFLAVLGPSGSGKSSLVRTGFLGALHQGFHPSAGSRWRIADMHPGGQPMRNLAAALLRTREGAEFDPTDRDLLTDFLGHGPRSMSEWISGGNLDSGWNLLLIVDQFEELFRYGDYSQREEAEAFIALLLESTTSTAPIHAVITMRSEYLGACGLMEGLAERINAGMYLTPRMNRENCRAAIEGPAGVMRFRVEPALVNRLLNDLGSFAPWGTGGAVDEAERLSRLADQLPVMQHVLNRLYLQAQAAAGGGAIVLTLQEYERIGGLSGALDSHGAEILAALGPDRERQTERIFRSLVAGTSVSNAVRRPCRIRELRGAADGRQRDTAAIVDAFRARGCNFLQTSGSGLEDDDTIVDISHESLIRQWTPLRNWLEHEIADGASWRHLLSRAERYRDRQGGLLAGLDLQNLTEWQKSFGPTAPWAARHGGGFEVAIAFLDSSQRAEEQRAAAEHALRSRERNKWRIAAVTLGTALIASMVLSYGVRHEAAVAARSSEEALRQRTAAVHQTEIAEKRRLEADVAKSKSDQDALENAKRLEGISEIVNSDKYNGLVGLAGLRSELMQQLRGYQSKLADEHVGSVATESAMHDEFRLALSFEGTGDAIKARDSLKKSFEIGLRAIESSGRPADQLIWNLVRAGSRYSWFLLDIGEVDQGGRVIEGTRVYLGGRKPDNAEECRILSDFENLEARYYSDKSRPDLSLQHHRESQRLATRAAEYARICTVSWPEPARISRR